MEKNMVFNACQTPLEELELEKYPQEVQEMFWDFLNNIPFIKWLVSPDRPYVSQLPRDEYGRAIFDVSCPPILENSAFFRKSALAWINDGRYTMLKPNLNPNSEFGRWQLNEAHLSRSFAVDPKTGMWITGDYYYMLNYCPMHLTEKGEDGIVHRVMRHPHFWDGQFFVTHYMFQSRMHGHHSFELASRGKGKTSLGGAMLARRFELGETDSNKENIQCFCTADDRSRLISQNQILTVFKDDIDFAAKHTQFPSSRLKNSLSDMTWTSGFKKVGSDVEYGSKNSVTGTAAGINQDKLNGSRGVLYLIEEAGIFKDLKALYNMIRPSVEQGGEVFGQIIAYGTAGDDQSDFVDFADMFYSPEGWNIEPLPNVFDKEGQGKNKIGMFYPVYLNYDNSCIDKDGNSDVTKALLMVCADRYKIKYNSSDVNALTKRISQYPVTPKEAIIRSHGNYFPVTDLNNRLDQIDNNPSEYDDVYVGMLKQNAKTGEIEFEPTSDIPIRDFPTKDNKVNGAIEIYAMPQKGANGKVPAGRYIAAADPYDNDVADTMSLGSFMILDLWTDNIVMEYTGRPDFSDDFYEICRRGCLFYNATMLYENNKKGLYPYFSKRNSLYLLADTPEYLLQKQIVKTSGYGNCSKGVSTTTPVINHGFSLIRNWLLKSVTKTAVQDNGEETEVTVPHLYDLRSRAFLKELVLFNPDINVDRIMCACMLMIYREQQMVWMQGEIKTKEEDVKGVASDSYWSKNYPGKKSERGMQSFTWKT